MVDNKFEHSRSLDPNTLNYLRIKMLERIRHSIDEGFINTSDSHLTEVMIDLKTLLEDVETEMANRGMKLKKISSKPSTRPSKMQKPMHQ
jgi:hypothetical protein